MIIKNIMLKPLKYCRICGNSNLVKVLDLGEQFLTGIFPKKKDQIITCGPLQLVKCHDEKYKNKCCGLLQLAHSYDSSEMYGDNYGYRSGLNQSMVSHLQKKVLRIQKMVHLKDDDLIIDIGSNDATTLKAYKKNTYQLVGIDPVGNKFKEYYPPNIKLINDFFSLGLVKSVLGDKKAKVITSFSMFYDLPNPLEFMKEVSDVMTPDGIWVFEQSYMPEMLDQNAYDTVCHEHLEYYGLYQIKWMTDKLDLKIIDVEFNNINGGSFSVTVAHAKSDYKTYTKLDQILKEEKSKSMNELNPYIKFANRVKDLKKEFIEFLDNAKLNRKKIGALGASTKGNVVLQYCGVTEDKINFIGDVNPDKYGSFTPGTLIPIIDENTALKKNYDYLIVLPWHFKNFFLENNKFDNSKLVFPLPTLNFDDKKS